MNGEILAYFELARSDVKRDRDFVFVIPIGSRKRSFKAPCVGLTPSECIIYKMVFLLLAILTFFVITLFGHVAHWFIHQPLAGKFNRSHMTHHLKLYPPTDYLSKKYRHPGKDNTVLIFAILSIPMLILPWVALGFGVITLFQALFIFVEMLILGAAHDYVHDAFHIKGHWLYKFKMFRKWNVLHYRHHVNMKSNFGIFYFMWDRVFGTLSTKGKR